MLESWLHGSKNQIDIDDSACNPTTKRVAGRVGTDCFEKALANEREERYQTAKGLSVDLKRLKQHLEGPVQTSPALYASLLRPAQLY